MKQFDVVAMGELLIDFTENGASPQGNPLLEANPGGAPCNVRPCLRNSGKEPPLSARWAATSLAAS